MELQVGYPAPLKRFPETVGMAYPGTEDREVVYEHLQEMS
jgi:hypothetical protein